MVHVNRTNNTREFVSVRKGVYDLCHFECGWKQHLIPQSADAHPTLWWESAKYTYLPTTHLQSVYFLSQEEMRRWDRCISTHHRPDICVNKDFKRIFFTFRSFVLTRFFFVFGQFLFFLNRPVFTDILHVGTVRPVVSEYEKRTGCSKICLLACRIINFPLAGWRWWSSATS